MLVAYLLEADQRQVTNLLKLKPLQPGGSKGQSPETAAATDRQVLQGRMCKAQLLQVVTAFHPEDLQEPPQSSKQTTHMASGGVVQHQAAATRDFENLEHLSTSHRWPSRGQY